MKRNEMIEVSFLKDEPEGSQVQVDLTATITGPDGEKTVKGFYAGNQTFKVRFLPEQEGSYVLKTSGIMEEERHFFIEPADEKHHGVVRANGTHFYHQDGTGYTGFGTTVYALANQKKELMDETIETLSHAPFNKIRMCVFPKHYNYNLNEPDYYAFQKTEEGWDVHHPDFMFWDNFEEQLQKLFALGIQVDLILFHPYDRWGFSTLTREDSLVYLDYVVRRFSAYPNIWWSLANEYDLLENKSEQDWDAFGMFLYREDAYHHLIGNHNCFKFFDPGKEYITHASIQTHAMNLVAELQEQYQKPVCYDECCYEGNLNDNWGNLSGREMTRRFWQATVTGGHCTHGETFLDPDKVDDIDSVIWWAKGGQLIGESPKRIAFLRSIVEELPGVLDPFTIGLGRMMVKDPQKQKQVLQTSPEHMKTFISAIQKMNEMETARFLDMDFEYAGHIKDDVFLYYLDHHTPARRLIELPSTDTYTIEVIDTWNMTREVYAKEISVTDDNPYFEVRLPGREYMAILVYKNDVLPA